MHKIIATALVVLCAATATLPARADDLTAAKKADILKLMEITGALRIGDAMSQSIVAQITQNLKARQPPLPQKAYEIVADEVPKVISEELTAKGGYIDQITPVYHRHMTDDEIKGLIAFYSTPLGKKAVSVMPMIAQEGMAVAKGWARTIGPKLDQRLKASFKQAGIDIDAKPQPGANPAPSGK
ncbi:MAG: DUF2059 domain-containing protein [Betaproteobacteria bacterium]|nr:DUF2059 domain-containing protein [Betaproteobacteria bacterium]